jgi:hypothetical protein
MKKNSSSKLGFFTPRFLLGISLFSTGAFLAIHAFGAPLVSRAKSSAANSTTFQPVIRYSLYNGVSPRMRDLPVVKNTLNGDHESHAPLPIHPPHAAPQLPVVDPIQQLIMPALAMAAPIQTFEGMNQADGCGNCIPPDPNGVVGPNHYVEMVNSSYSVYTKTGTRLVGPIHINQLWANSPRRCQVDNDGDPVVVYDHLADRWVLTQFAVNGGNGPFAQCVAVSTSPDPTGSFYVYEFDQPIFNDYPKFGVWPDAYYMTANEFGGTGGTFSGAGVYAFERAAMLTGQVAREVFFDLGTVNSSFGGMLPGTVDGAPPPVGSPDYFAEVDSQANSPMLGADAMRIWKFHVDWSNTNNSTFGLSGLPNSTLPVTTWGPPQCVYGVGTCVPQEGSPYQLDVLGDRLMQRLVYRNFGDHESLLINHSIIADVRIGIRWYEVRGLSSTPTLYQQSTWAPVDTMYRWMGSITMDHFGDLAIGYSTSSPASFPSIAYAGRLAGDPLSQLPQGETQMWAGLGPENVAAFVPPEGRWGDYSALTVDPTDGCTFWYVNEYFASITDQGANLPDGPWQTRIGSFKFPQCVATQTPVVGVASRKTHGNAGTFDINLPLTGSPGIECRSGAANGDHTIVFTFANILTNVADANVTSGTGTVSGKGVGADPRQYIVNLTGVTNAETITVSLTNVYDNAGNSSSVISVPMGVLAGDTNADGIVNSADIGQTKSQSGNGVTSSNFREDVNTDGFINSADIGLVKSKSGTGLP